MSHVQIGDNPDTALSHRHVLSDNFRPYNEIGSVDDGNEVDNGDSQPEARDRGEHIDKISH